MSDVHFDRSHADASAERVRLGKAIRFMNEFSQAQPYKGFDALVVAGDLSNHGVPEELVPFKKILDDNLRPSTKRVLCMGNHEHYGGNRELWQQIFETNANRRQEINGYQFIAISPEKGTCRDDDYSYLREWLAENLAAAASADPEKPIFVVQHYHVRDTVYGSWNKPGDFPAGTKDLTEILKKYPQVVHISGHSHVPSYDPRAVWQGGFTCFGTGSLSYFALLTFERERNFQFCSDSPYRRAGTFLIFEVYQDAAIRVRLYDLESDSFLDREYLVLDPKNVDKYVYTDKRFEEATAPRWPDGASAEILETSPTAATLQFSQAVDDFCVVSYRVVVEAERDGKWSEIQTRFVWSDYYMKKPADKLRLDLLELPSENRLRASVFATGAFQKETLEPIRVEFATPSPASDVDRSDPNPRGDFLDVLFDPEKGPINANPKIENPLEIVAVGNPKIVDDPSLGSVASLNGVDQCYFAPFSGIRSGNIGNEISLFLRFRLDLSKKKDQETISLFGSTESGGLGFEYYPKSKQLASRCWVDDKYSDLAVDFDSDQETVAVFTYDGKETRLYLDGNLVASAKAEGKFRFTQHASARAFCIGADVCPDRKARWFFPGEIAGARVYAWALSPEQVANVSK